MYQINKSFEFSYGHRVYSQNVNEEFAGSSECPCRRIHGHNGVVTVRMEAKHLDTRDFVIDFKELSFVKQFLDSCIDHRFIISGLDPGFGRLVGCDIATAIIKSSPRYIFPSQKRSLMGRMFDRSPQDDHLNSFFLVDFNPTSENLSKWIYNGLWNLIEASNFECNVESVTWSETRKTGATYRK